MPFVTRLFLPWILATSIMVLTLPTHAQISEKAFDIRAGRLGIKISNKYGSYGFRTKYNKDYQTCLSQSDTLISISCSDSFMSYIKISIPCRAQHYFGLGEQYSHIDFRQTSPYVFTEEQGIGRGDKPISGVTRLFGVSGNEFSSYAPMNFFFTEEHKAYILEGGSYIKYDFSNSDHFSLESWGRQLRIKTIQGSSPKDILTQSTGITGRMPVLPEWALGTWLGLQGGSEKVERILERSMATEDHVTAVWIQDWVGRRKTKFGSQLWWTWEADSTAYPDFKAFCTRLSAKGVRVLGYINSFVANQGRVYEEARSKGYLVKDSKGGDYAIKTALSTAYLIDLTNPEAVVWLKGIIKHNLIDQGLSGWMADYGEWLPMDAKLFSGVSAFDYHDQYAVDWARVNREAIREAGREGDIVFFNRSGALGSAKYSTLFWAGDQMVSWGQNDGLPSAICAMVTSGLSGISINHTDIGGYTTVDNALLKVKRDEELLKRWIEFAAFTPVYRTHEGLKPESNVQIYSSDSILRFFARFGRIHWGLRDYFKELNKESASQGIPIVRALLLEFPNDTLTYSIKDQFMLGPDLLVAPVITRGAVSRSVYFPEGQWINIWTKEKVEGNSTHIVSAPIGSPPVYIRQNSQWTDRLTQCLK